MSVLDLLIIGGGPAGLTAGIYAGRAKLKTALLERLMPGGEVASTEWVENYPGFDEGIAGPDLMKRMEKQALRFGLDILNGQVERLDLTSNPKKVITPDQVYEARTLLLATGTDPKRLDIPGEDEFRGRGVSYCATCDGPFFQNKDIVVVGGGSSGIQESLYLTRFVNSIKLVEFTDRLNAEPILQDRARANPKFSFYLNHRILEIKGEKTVRSVVIADRASENRQELPADGVFVWIGLNPNTAFLKEHVSLNAWGYVVTDETMQTSVPGVYAAGDVREKSVRQITTAVSDGTIAVQSALNYLENVEESGG
ncbi:MAG TPA: thioredoxin-disulfide reductase [bacterium]|nr:thioredoxin-disulfide reductase [bacterium]